MKVSRLILLLIIFLAVFLRFYKIGELYSFIGDQGWFYLSAKDFLSGQVPLVGIASSYTWVHQGALWTYLLAPILLLFHFNPVGGAYFSALLGVISVWVIYVVGKTLFKSETVGLISALLFAVSPLIISYSRMPYHTSPIPLLVLILIYTLYKYATGKDHYLIVSAFMLGILYNLELATMVLWFLPVILVIKVRKFNLRLLFLSFFAFLAPLIPMILYDIQQKSGLYQITAFPRLIKLSLFNSNGIHIQSYLNVLKDLTIYNQELIFVSNKILSILAVLFSVGFLVWQFFKERNRKSDYGVFILSLWIFLSFAGIIFSKTASQAYLPMFYPGIILLVSYALIKITEINTGLKPIIYAVIILFSILNIHISLVTNFLTKGTNVVFVAARMKTAKDIIELSNGKKYNLISRGAGSEFENNLRNYEYLLWWLGNQPSSENEKLKFIIEEKNGIIYLTNE